MNIGDKIKIKNLELIETNKTPFLTNRMKQYSNKEAYIMDIVGENYLLDIDNGDYLWSKEWFENEEA